MTEDPRLLRELKVVRNALQDAKEGGLHEITIRGLSVPLLELQAALGAEYTLVPRSGDVILVRLPGYSSSAV